MMTSFKEIMEFLDKNKSFLKAVCYSGGINNSTRAELIERLNTFRDLAQELEMFNSFWERRARALNPYQDIEVAQIKQTLLIEVFGFQLHQKEGEK